MENIIKFNGQDIKLNLRDEADISVMREIFKIREYRIAEDIITSAQEPIVDIGAHAGFFSIYCRILNPKVKIFALEPEKNNLKAIKTHLKDNKIKNVTVLSGALAGSTGERLLEISDDSHNHKLLEKDGRSFATLQDDNYLKIKVFSLSDFCKENKIKIISLLKMDIEGGEYEVFESLTPKNFLLFKNLILEYHSTADLNFEIIENKLRENGFGVSVFPSKFDKSMGFIFARNKRIK